ncbi:MAG: hypothetical protein HC945_00920 [Nitrosarchaeum sp.]|nr:hypothetical protein [Nitrosarchaeum sp.]
MRYWKVDLPVDQEASMSKYRVVLRKGDTLSEVLANISSAGPYRSLPYQITNMQGRPVKNYSALQAGTPLDIMFYKR